MNTQSTSCTHRTDSSTISRMCRVSGGKGLPTSSMHSDSAQWICQTPWPTSSGAVVTLPLMMGRCRSTTISRQASRITAWKMKVASLWSHRYGTTSISLSSRLSRSGKRKKNIGRGYARWRQWMLPAGSCIQPAITGRHWSSVSMRVALKADRLNAGSALSQTSSNT